MTHRPILAPPPGYTGPKHALILAGGGMRLSYAAGVIKALYEAGLRFTHYDGTSGGALNLAMLLSGLSPDEMVANWRSLDPKDFVSLLPLADYLKAGKLKASGDADNVRKKVLPHLGIDPAKVRAAAGVDAWFNVLNFSTKVNEIIPHTAVDEDFLIAGMSLPGVYPPVPKNGALYLDSAFVRDANLLEAARRGAEELWVVWVLGNTQRFRGGMLDLYVQMLEMSANGMLHVEFDQINEINARRRGGEAVYGSTRPLRLHLIKPQYPLPLDPDLFLGKIDHPTLISMGYTDAAQYLKSKPESGMPFSPEATKMTDTPLGITFAETMSGGLTMGTTDQKAGEKQGEKDGNTFAMHGTINIRDIRKFIADPAHAGEIHGSIDYPPLGTGMPSKVGVFNLFSPTDMPNMKFMVYEMGFTAGGRDYYFAGRKEVHDDRGFDLWSDTTTLYTNLHAGTDKTGPIIGAGILHLSLAQLTKMVPTFAATGAASAKDKMEAINAFGKFFMGELWDTYRKLVKADDN
jgi:predicted acylesterase/phospholipase RssA